MIYRRVCAVTIVFPDPVTREAWLQGNGFVPEDKMGHPYVIGRELEPTLVYAPDYPPLDLGKLDKVLRPAEPPPAEAPQNPSAEPDDAELPFKTGDYQGKRLSDLSEAELRRLAAGFRRAAAEAKDAAARTDKSTWLDRVERWAAYRAEAR